MRPGDEPAFLGDTPTVFRDVASVVPGDGLFGRSRAASANPSQIRVLPDVSRNNNCLFLARFSLLARS